MHSLLKPEFPRLSSLSSHICKNKGRRWHSRPGEQISFLKWGECITKAGTVPMLPVAAGVSQGCLPSAGERYPGAEENHGLIFPNILLLQERRQLEIVLCYHDYCLKDMDRFVWGRGDFPSEIFYSPVSLLLAHILSRALTRPGTLLAIFPGLWRQNLWALGHWAHGLGKAFVSDCDVFLIALLLSYLSESRGFKPCS